jgi:hypothetical protein
VCRPDGGPAANVIFSTAFDSCSAYLQHFLFGSMRAHQALIGLASFFWRFANTIDYWIFQLRLRILDAVCGPEPPTAADQERTGDRDGMR